MTTATDDKRGEHLVLVADVGATYLRLALARNGMLLAPASRFERERFPDFEAACSEYLHEAAQGLRLDGAAVAAAGRLDAGCIELTNAGWRIDPTRLASAFGLRTARVALLNDFEALAWALPALEAQERQAIPGGARQREGASAPAGAADGHRAVLGAGSGLGVAALLRGPQGWIPLATEGGHASFAPETVFEREVAALAVQRFGRASWERILSGPGLVLLHEAARMHGGLQAPEIDLAPSQVVQACRDGDEAARLAVRTFVELVGAFAGDLALLYNASGGVMVGGGVVSELAQVIPFDGMRIRFEAKGRFRAWLQEVPLERVVAPFAALRGAAIAYCR